MDKIVWGPNWEEILGGEFEKRSRTRTSTTCRRCTDSSNTFMMVPAQAVRALPQPGLHRVIARPARSTSRREDGIVLIDQDKCRGWRMCVSGCPYRRSTYNWKAAEGRRSASFYPRIESQPATVCKRACVGRILCLGVHDDADPHRGRQCRRIPTATCMPGRSATSSSSTDPEGDRAQARSTASPDAGWKRRAARRCTDGDGGRSRCRCTRCRTLPMVWYVPPLSPIVRRADAGAIGSFGQLPEMCFRSASPVRSGHLLTAGAR